MTTAYLSPAKAAEKYPTLGNADWFRIRLRNGTLRGYKLGRWQIEEAAIEEMIAAASNVAARPENSRRRRRRAA